MPLVFGLITGHASGTTTTSPPDDVLPPFSTQAQPLTNEQRAAELSRQSGQRRPEDQYTTELFGRPLTIGGEFSIDSKYRRDFTLDSDAQDDLWRGEAELQLELFYQWTDHLFVFLEGSAIYKSDLYAEDGNEQNDDDLRRGQSWILATELFETPFSIQAGRQTVREKREWWWDESLDALRVHYDLPQFHAEFSAAEEVGPVSLDDDEIKPDRDDVFRVLGRATWKWTKRQRLSLFMAYQNDHSDTPQPDDVIDSDDEDDADAKLTWIGVRSMGRWKYRPLGRIDYWADTAIVRGDADIIDFDDDDSGNSVVDSVDHVDVEGWGADIGATLETRHAAIPRITLAYAWGSGDKDPDDNKDRSFQQTTLQDNNGRFRGVNRFRYYGELLRPELSNLRISTLSLGYPLLNNSSVELVYHDYRQVHADDSSRVGRIGPRPNGDDTDIGQELDLVFGFEETKSLEFEIIAAVFKSGEAYGDLSGNYAYNLELSMDYNF